MREANWFDIFGLLFNYSRCYRVEGNSMLPTLQDGDEVLVKPSQSYRIGDVIVAKHPFRKTPMIKRVTEISTGGKLFLRGDNPAESSDSRTFGGIVEKDILGKVECKIKRAV